MNNGNGKVDPRVVEAQRTVERTKKPLDEATKRAATTRLRLSECEQVLAHAEKAFDVAQDRWMEDDSPSCRQKLHATNDDVQAAKSRVEGLRKKLAAEEAAIAPLKAEHDAAQVALAQLQLLETLRLAEDKASASRDVVTKLEEQLVQARQVACEDERRFKTLATQVRESKQEQDRRDAAVRFRKLNPTPGFERQRSGFGL